MSETQKLRKRLARIEKELEGCRTSTLQDGWQSQRHAKKARKWDALAREKYELQVMLETLETIEQTF